MRRAVLLTAVAAGTLLPASAGAATVAVDDGVLHYEALPGEVNLVDVTYDPDYDTSSGPTIWILEYSAEVTPGSGCVPAPNVWGQRVGAACTGVTSVELDLGDGDDAMYGFLTEPNVVRGGAGDDMIWPGFGDDVVDAGPGSDRVLGDRGRDRIAGGEGDDTLDGDQGEPGGPAPTWQPLDGDRVVGEPDVVEGGPGDDVVLGDGGADVIRGGAGRDTVEYRGRRRAVTVTLDRGADDGEAGEGDDVGEVERVRGTDYADVVVGSAADDELILGAGADSADAGAGRDRVVSGAGDDRIEARDGAVDTLVCGPGTDSGRVDGEDQVTGDCDYLDRPLAAPRYAGTLRASARRARGGAVLVRGRLLLRPEHFAACAGASVTIRAVTGRRSASTAAPLNASCRFSARLPLAAPRRAAVSVTVELLDSARLVAAHTLTRARR